MEGACLDTGNAVGDCVAGPCLTCRISVQRSLFFIKQNAIISSIIPVVRANLNRCQASAKVEGGADNAGDAIRNRDTRQAGAVAEGLLPNAGDAAADCDAREACAVTEGGKPYAVDAIRDRDTRQAAALEGPLPDAVDAVRNRDAC